MDVAKVLDFGLAKDLQTNSDPLLSRADEIRGTPQYLAPESITNPEGVDARTDLYALAAVAYFRDRAARAHQVIEHLEHAGGGLVVYVGGHAYEKRQLGTFPGWKAEMTESVCLFSTWKGLRRTEENIMTE